jgi:hypothetical protein
MIMLNAYGTADQGHGIVCDAQNCYYNREGRACTAGQIKVGNTNACTSTDTACDTFKPR